jgi:hypothetical protein
VQVLLLVTFVVLALALRGLGKLKAAAKRKRS